MRLLILLIVLHLSPAAAFVVTLPDSATACPEESLVGYGILHRLFNTPASRIEDPDGVLLRLSGLDPKTATRQVDDEEICRAIRKQLNNIHEIQEILQNTRRPLVYTLHQLGPYYIAVYRAERPWIGQGGIWPYAVFGPDIEYLGTIVTR
jgi:hypothetical protein